MMTREEVIKRQNELLKKYEKVKEELLKYPGVKDLAIAVRSKNGKDVDMICFQAYVKEKKDLKDLKPEDVIPETIMGEFIDVITTPKEELEVNIIHDNKKYRPLKGGSQIRNSKYNSSDDGGCGTLGCIAIDKTNGDVVILSNHHVIWANGATVDTKVGQAKHVTSCCCTCYEVGDNVRFHVGFDCAIAKVTVKNDDGHLWYSPEVLEIGPLCGITDAVPFETVRKRGRTTGLTTGQVKAITYTNIGGVQYQSQIRIQTDNGNDNFSKGGDSGSVVVNIYNQVIGLHFAGNNRNPSPPYHSTSKGIKGVCHHLNIEIISTGSFSSSSQSSVGSTSSSSSFSSDSTVGSSSSSSSGFSISSSSSN